MEPKQVVTTTKRPIEDDNNNKSKKLKSDVVDIESDDKDTPNNNKNNKKNDLKANGLFIYFTNFFVKFSEFSFIIFFFSSFMQILIYVIETLTESGDELRKSKQLSKVEGKKILL